MTTAVLLVSHSPQRSGAEKVMLDVAAECARRGADVAVACPAGPLSDSFEPWITHVEIPHLGRDHGRRSPVAVLWGMMLAYIGAARVLRRHRDRMCIANSSHTLPALRLAGFRSIAWLVHDHVVDRKMRVFARIGAPLLDRVVAVSPTTADGVRDLVPHVRVGRLGVDVPDRVPSAPAAHPVRVGTLSVVTPWKGLHVFLDAVSLLPQATAVVAGEAFPGDVDYAATLRERSEEPDLAGRVEFPGRVRGETAMESWSVHVSASVKPEAGPLTVLEAMAAGVPVVATDHGGPHHLLADGRGVLVAPDDPSALAAGIASLARDGAEVEAMVRRAFDHVAAHHDRRQTVPALVDLLIDPARDTVRLEPVAGATP
ncbi:MAG: glycosyltransferase family 4 protein [Gordonia paraffinivorans]